MSEGGDEGVSLVGAGFAAGGASGAALGAAFAPELSVCAMRAAACAPYYELAPA